MHRLSGLFDRPSLSAGLLGAALLALGLILLAFTERADGLRVMADAALGGFVLTGDAAVPGSAADGKLVLASGAPDVKSPARDAQFGVSIDAPALLRQVEMFQWNQTGMAAHAGYEMGWFDHPIDSAGFARPAGHANPGPFPIGAARFDAPEVRVAGFKLAPQLVQAINGAEPFKPDLSHLPANMAATFDARDGTLVTSTDPAHPKVGDLRIRWLRVAPRELTVFARDQHGTLAPARNAAGHSITQVLIGRLSLGDVLPDAPRRPRFLWARRVLAVLLAWAGVALLLPLAHRPDRWLALALAVVPLALVAAAEWFAVAMLAFAIPIAIAVLAALASAWRWRRPGEA